MSRIYRYGMRLRGFSIGCQPMDGFLEREDDTSGKYHDIVTYSRRLTDKEVQDYELDYLGGEGGLKRGISILPMNCQAYRDGYRYGAYEEDGEEQRIVEFFVDTDEAQDFVNDHPEYGVPEAAATLAGVLRGDREKTIGNSLYRIACDPDTRKWFVQEIFNGGNSYGLARGLYHQNLGDTVKDYNLIDRERYLIDREEAQTDG